MASHYSTRDFFRLMPNALLARYFRGQSVFGELDFEAMKESKPEPLMAAWTTLDDDVRARLEADLRAVHELSNRKGLLAIQDAARAAMDGDSQQIAEFMERMAALKDHHSQAMTTFLDFRHLWLWAERFHHADRLSYWKKRNDLPRVDAAADAAGLASLAALMKAYFIEAEGRGRNCRVEHYRRGNRDLFFAFPEDHASRAVEWVNGDLGTRPHNPAFEIVFVYEKESGSLELFCRGAPKAVLPLQSMFAKAILRQADLPPARKGDLVYDLDALRHASFEFVQSASSGIDSIAVKKLRLSARSGSGDRITLEADPAGDRLAVYDLLDRIGKSVALDDFHVTLVELTASVWVGPGRPRKKVTFTVAHPNSCTLRHDGLDEGLRAMLVASGIEPKLPEKPQSPPVNDSQSLPT